ncbi:glycosyltransferase [Holdemanella porci]|uniref:glycosyltransferase n=1 Tax=Holdemanella porci TaxID=2652276 RepID=UPI00388D8042
MKILMINVTCGTGSTGRICTDLAEVLSEKGHEVKIAFGRDEVPEKFKKYAVRIGSDLDVNIHALKARLFDSAGFESKKVTKEFIKWVKDYDPDIIHLHNIHGYYINVEILFNYLKTYNKRIIWTFHDSWAFTGHTPYCDVINCEKWKDGCHNCTLKKEYPKTYLDYSKRNWKIKKELFTNVKCMQIVTPSNWLQGLVKESFLKEYDVSVINNGINTKAFYPRKSHILKDYGIKDKFIVLGVSSVWDHMKGLDDYLELSHLLSDDCKLVLVGLTQEQVDNLPSNILGITRTESIDQLAMIYSESDVFVNLSYCENYPTVNIEALACGTPVLTYETGGSPEIVRKYGGAVVEKKNILAVKNKIDEMMKTNTSIAFVPEENDVDHMIKKYLKIYEMINDRRKI